jgi:hypothetical protein
MELLEYLNNSSKFVCGELPDALLGDEGTIVEEMFLETLHITFVR